MTLILFLYLFRVALSITGKQKELMIAICKEGKATALTSGKFSINIACRRVVPFNRH